MGWGSSTRRGGSRQVRALPQKFVFLGFRREEFGMSREFCQDVPDPWRCSKTLCKKKFVFIFPPINGGLANGGRRYLSTIAKFRHGSTTVITPLKTNRADFKIKQDQGKIEEDRGRSRKGDRGRSRKGQSNLSGDTFSLEAPQNLLRTKRSILRRSPLVRNSPLKVATNFLENILLVPL